MRALVTGAGGFIGSHVAKLATESGQDIRCVVMPGEDTSLLKSLGVEIVIGNLVDPEVARKAVKGCEVVYNAAGRAGDYGTFDDFYRPNFMVPETVLKAAIDAGVRRFVHASSMLVSLGGSFHYWRGGVIAEQIPEPPRFWRWDYYARSKIAIERVLLNAQDRIETVPLRIGWVYGPRDRTSFPRLVDLVRGGRGLIIGDGNNRLGLVYAEDLANAFLLAGKAGSHSAQAYAIAGVADENPITQAEYMNAIADLVGARRPTLRLPFRVALGLGTTMEALWHWSRRKKAPLLTSFAVHLLGRDQLFDTSRAQRFLGWAPKMKFGDGIRRTLEWLEQERANAKGRGVLS